MQYSTAQFLVEGAGVHALLPTFLFNEFPSRPMSRQPSFELVLSVRLGPARFSDGRTGGLGGGSQVYLLGLLAMIKCSICSYQCEN